MAEPSEEMISEREWRLRDDLRKHWDAFCDADPVPGDFIDEMEAAGFAEIRTVTRDDLRSDFAAERGIYKGGMVWDLTPKGRAILAPSERPAPGIETGTATTEGRGAQHESPVTEGQAPTPIPDSLQTQTGREGGENGTDLGDLLAAAQPTISRQGTLIMLDCPDGTITDELFDALEQASGSVGVA